MSTLTKLVIHETTEELDETMEILHKSQQGAGSRNTPLPSEGASSGHAFPLYFLPSK